MNEEILEIVGSAIGCAWLGFVGFWGIAYVFKVARRSIHLAGDE